MELIELQELMHDGFEKDWSRFCQEVGLKDDLEQEQRVVLAAIYECGWSRGSDFMAALVKK